MNKNSTIKIDGLSDLQRRIATILWECETQAQVDAVCVLLGHQALVVKEMIIAATLDTVDDVGIAQRVLDQFRD